MANLFDVADFFIQIANQSEDDQMTNLKLNKLLYFAQGAYLARTGHPLFDTVFEAWQYGPVVPEIYNKYKSCGKMPIQANDKDFDKSNFSDEEFETLMDTMREFGKYTGSMLVSLTHKPDTPWSKAREYRLSIISNTDMKEYFTDNPVPYIGDKINAPKVNKLPSDWYDPEEDSEWEAYL